MSEGAGEIGLTIRRLLRRSGRVGLGTLDRRDGGPYVSLAMVALAQDATPLLYLSDLADHSKNLQADPRVSLLFDGTLASAIPLAGERATVQGRAERATEPHLLARYLARHPDAAAYTGFADFNLYRVSIDRAHLVAGFGRIDWVDGAAVRLAPGAGDALVTAEPGVIEHMNADHADAIALYARQLLGRDGEGWTLTGVDPDGCDLRRESEVVRLWFDAPVHDAASARMELVRLARLARAEASAA